MNAPHEAPSGSLAVPLYAPPAHIAEGSLLWEQGCRKLTCRKAYHFVCSAWEDCRSDHWLEAGDQRQAERSMRDKGWSYLADLGWTCKPCVAVYATGHQKSALGPHKLRRTYASALTAREQRERKRTQRVQDEWRQIGQTR